ncbi:type II secretion system GspH family protein [Psychrosphaera haliotis]|nr:type II secretion system GspH family protein [Psychrosphaera haliotis]
MKGELKGLQKTNTSHTRGFTLIELIVVILLIAVLGVTALPKLQGTSDYTLTSQRDQLISLLRTVQMRAMQNTQKETNTCHRIIFQSDKIGLNAQNTSGANIGGCGSGLINVSNNQTSDFLIIEDLSPYTATNRQGSPITEMNFDSWGQTELKVGNCAKPGCKITLDTGYAVCINGQGYINACQ